MANPLAAGIVPAQLGFLAIYNPSLGTTDETVEDQIVYYASASTQSSAKRRRHRAAKDGRPTDILSNEERNERLRQIGLAQGMVEFGRSFSGGKAVDSIDTERTRVVLHELEPGWWILASIDLTRLPSPPTKITSSTPPPQRTKTSTPPPPKFEYSSREVKPPALLLQDLLRAHALFLLHHRPSLSALLNPTPATPNTTDAVTATPDTTPTTPTANTSRPPLTALLARYWDLFLSTWNVLLHGNPACAVFAGIKVAACGELGMGVGEEDRGSGEREVLEGLVGSGEGGLVDLVVGRFGGIQDRPPLPSLARSFLVPTFVGKGGGKGKERAVVGEGEGWLGLGKEVGPEDGLVFLGAGALLRPSLRAVASWMEDVYTWGESAYGVFDGAVAGGAARTKRRRTVGKKAGVARVAAAGDGKKVQRSTKPKSATPEASGAPGIQDGDAQPGQAAESALPDAGEANGGMDKMFSYLKLGYGTYWSLGTASPATNSDADDESTPNPADTENAAAQKPAKDPDAGFFLVGLDKQGTESEQPEQLDSPERAERASPPTVTVELDPKSRQGGELGVVGSPSIDPSNQTPKKTNTTQLRPVIYAHRPFIYILLFQPNTTTPSWDELSQSLHSQLTRLHKPLLTSTAYRPDKPNLGVPTTSQSEIYDLVFDPHTLTIHSTIPNIPNPTFLIPNPSTILAPLPSSPAAAWSRVEALNTHNQILNMFAGSRGDLAALERTCKTSRGWWVVWNRVLEQRRGTGGEVQQQQQAASSLDEGEGSDDASDEHAAVVGKEIFLVRRASDHGGVGGVRGVSVSYVGGASGGWTDGASRLAQGIGVDTRRYIEGLLSLNR
ncbi:hypothetical protein CHGG_00524 [Chaetomium globosum CBS 148.51]|uniref:CCZ1/INTU/HSP4 first Longin domain-containing protein n=1 Tax=Chaetomium globosum (strain ATCC 6205 / CBS 148.51 / DSM 1962 / NBRC 6347 / NRRL 1970) TaxID=306901 RepID=Q2HGY0_CHAGB|nr:uncharacterized protein CHGG_00524 [Chaetomium globosum CBS 148.51]EAQ92289.1 hypothetical protein CHGG_00524 [Chaetomium globosum CBS 148.51]